MPDQPTATAALPLREAADHDAPVHFDAGQAAAWSAGYEAAIYDVRRELRRHAARLGAMGAEVSAKDIRAFVKRLDGRHTH